MTASSYSLPHLSLLRVSGEDAEHFLQGQLTNDLKQLDDKWQFSGYCNPKGRLLALFQVWRNANHIYLMLPTELIESVRKRLTMYVLRSKVNIDINSTHTIYGLMSLNTLEKANSNLAKQAESSQQPNAIWHDNEDTLLSWQNRFLYITTKQINTKPDNAEWQHLDIQQGLPSITASTSELFIPQMVNLDLLNGINFKKGCYTGQEIVARMHYLGKVKQRLFVLNGKHELTDSINNGDKIYLQTSPDKSIGQIVNKVNGSNILLAAIRTESANQTMALTNGMELDLNLNEQPYKIEL